MRGNGVLEYDESRNTHAALPGCSSGCVNECSTCKIGYFGGRYDGGGHTYAALAGCSGGGIKQLLNGHCSAVMLPTRV